MDQYIGFLRHQANGRWKGLPPSLISKIAGYYPEIDLSQVAYAEDINTVHRKAITIGRQIFIPWEIAFDNRRDLQLIFHELEHVVQYARRGGERPFLAEYIAKIPGKIIQKKSFEIHDDIDLENAAIAKSFAVVDNVYGWNLAITNNCQHGISLAIDYRAIDGQWVTDGYWSINPNQKIVLGNGEGGDIHTANRVYYVYAETTDDSGITWSGDLKKHVDVDGRDLSFLKNDDERPRIDELESVFVCD